jgi:hypothetical protein
LENVIKSSTAALHSELDTLHNEVKIDIGILNSAIQQNSNVLQQTVRSGGGLGGGGAGGKINPPLRLNRRASR